MSMDVKNDLIVSIGKQLNIPKTNSVEWVCQIIYSVAGCMALASLWDHIEDKSSISLQHFKKRIAQIFDAYEDLYPETSSILPADKTDLINEIYSIYLRSGHFYHSAYQLSPAAPMQSVHEDLLLYRGFSPDTNLLMSGLGFYSISNQENNDNGSIAAMFNLQEQPFEKYLHELLDYSEWEDVDWQKNHEFLRLDPPFSKGYWKQEPDRDGRISLAKHGDPNKIFAFYQHHDGVYQQKAIPQWCLQDYFSDDTGGFGEYRRIAIALLKQYCKLPKIKVKTIDDYVEIKLGYRLPPSEETFFKLYSWPTQYRLPQFFTRKMVKRIYPMFKHELEVIGYCFEEE